MSVPPPIYFRTRESHPHISSHATTVILSKTVCSSKVTREPSSHVIITRRTDWLENRNVLCFLTPLCKYDQLFKLHLKKFLRTFSKRQVCIVKNSYLTQQARGDTLHCGLLIMNQRHLRCSSPPRRTCLSAMHRS